MPILRGRPQPQFEAPGGPGAGAPPPAELPGQPPAEPPEPASFSRDYVRQLREEAAGLRIKLRDERAAHVATRTQLTYERAITDGLYRHGLDAKLARAVLSSEPERLSELGAADAPDIDRRHRSLVRSCGS